MKLKKFDLEHNHCVWWLRSADSRSSYYVGCVISFGYVSYGSANYYDGVLPACIII